MKLFRKLLSLTLALLLVSGIMMPSGITVHAASRAKAEGISVNTLPEKLEYEAGELLDLTGLTVKVVWNNNKSDIFSLSELAEKDITVTPAHGTELTAGGKNTVTVSLDSLSDRFDVEVKAPQTLEPVEITVNTLPEKLEYEPGEQLDLTGLTVKVAWNNGKSDIFSLSELAEQDITVTPAHGTELTAGGKNTVTVSLDSLSDRFDVEVKAPQTVELVEITVNTLPDTTEYILGQKLELTGMTAKLHYSDGSSEIISVDDFAKHGIRVTPAQGALLDTEGKNTVTLTVGEFTDSFEITVSPVTVSAITVNTPPDKLEYLTGEELDLTGLTVKLHYSDGGSNIFTPDELADKDITVTPAQGTVLAEAGRHSVTLEYTAVNGGSLAAEFEITVAAASSAERVIDRIFGSTRYETAFAVSAKWDKADTVIIASGREFADALAAGPLSAAADAPVLLAGGAENGTLLKEIDRLGARKAYILGGENAVGSDIEKLLIDADIAVTRLGGTDRYATAAAIAAELAALGYKTELAFVVSGESFADALSAGFAAAQKGAPILYTAKAGLNNTTAAYISDNGIAKAVIIGGEQAVSAQTEQQLEDITDTGRISGADRYLTSLAVAREYALAENSARIAIATGKNFPDALTGGAYAIRLGIPVMLVGDSAGEELLGYLDETGTESIIIFGGENAVSDELADTLK